MPTRPAHTDGSYSTYNIFWETEHESPEELSGKNHGGNFVDIPLKVIVQGAADTLCAFKPQFLHGTTIPQPQVKRMGIVIGFSKHILTAYKKALAKAGDNGKLPIRTYGK